MNNKVLIGNRYGRWTVVDSAEARVVGRGEHRRYWLCKCECGTQREVSEPSLLSGKSLSCGCYHRDRMKSVGKVNLKHGMSDTRLYRIYKHMKNRCYNQSDIRYDRYGGRGIKICDEWSEFEPFMIWALKNGYDDSLTIDRIDVDGDYSPSNCRWASVKEQNNNRSSSHYYTIDGVTHNISEWANIYNVPYKRVWKRLKYGWDIQRALTEPSTY